MVNNLEQISDLLNFESEDDFYHLQIIKRKKEHKDLGSNSACIKTYYVSSIEYLNLKFPEIKSLCDFHNARACINLNKRSFEKIGFHTLRKITDQIMNKDFKSIRKAYESVCGTYSNESNKKWIIDIDEKNLEFVEIIKKHIESVDAVGKKDIAIIETKNGYHLISKPFNLLEFRRDALFDNIDFHKDNPTILYIP